MTVAGASLSLAGLASDGHVRDAGAGLRWLSVASLVDGWEAIRPQGSNASAIGHRVLLEAEDLILVRDGGRAPMAIAESRLSMQGDGMVVEPGAPLTSSWHGAAVMARSDGRLPGCCSSRKEWPGSSRSHRLAVEWIPPEAGGSSHPARVARTGIGRSRGRGQVRARVPSSDFRDHRPETRRRTDRTRGRKRSPPRRAAVGGGPRPRGRTVVDGRTLSGLLGALRRHGEEPWGSCGGSIRTLREWRVPGHAGVPSFLEASSTCSGIAPRAKGARSCVERGTSRPSSIPLTRAEADGLPGSTVRRAAPPRPARHRGCSSSPGWSAILRRARPCGDTARP